jgi:hypothetical protein
MKFFERCSILVGSNIFTQTYKGKVKRIVARDNDGVNETWISDRDRFNIINTCIIIIKYFIFACKLQNTTPVFRECVEQIKYYYYLILQVVYIDIFILILLTKYNTYKNSLMYSIYATLFLKHEQYCFPFFLLKKLILSGYTDTRNLNLISYVNYQKQKCALFVLKPRKP